MSENIIKEVTEALDGIKSDVAEQTAPVAGLTKSVEELTAKAEGFVSKEAHDELKESVSKMASADSVEEVTDTLKQLSARFESLPGMEKTTMNTYKGISDQFAEAGKDNIAKATLAGDQVIKAVVANNSIPGSPVDAVTTNYVLAQGNVLRGRASMMDVTGDSFKLPILSGIAAANRTASNPGTPTRTDPSAVASSTIQVLTYDSTAVIGIPSDGDIPGLDQSVSGLMVQQLGVTEAASHVNTLDAASIGEVNLARVSNAFPSTKAAFDACLDLVADLNPMYYDGAAFMMSQNAWFNLRQASSATTGGSLLFDAALGGFMLAGFPVIINSHLDAGNAAGNNPVYFGKWDQGFMIGARADIEVDRNPYTNIGNFTYYGKLRSGGAVWIPEALRRLNMT